MTSKKYKDLSPDVKAIFHLFPVFLTARVTGFSFTFFALGLPAVRQYQIPPCTISRARLIASGVEIHDFFMITFHPNHSLSFFLTKCQPVAYYIMVCLWTCICKEQDRYGFERIR